MKNIFYLKNLLNFLVTLTGMHAPCVEEDTMVRVYVRNITDNGMKKINTYNLL